MSAYAPPVSPRSLFAILIAMAMLFAPFAMQHGGAMAAAPSKPHSQMMPEGHCGGQPNDGKAAKAIDGSCCATMCASIVIAPMSPTERLALSRSAERPSPQAFQHSYLAKLPTPPPRGA